MNCFVGIIMIAGIGINPCNITNIHRDDYYWTYDKKDYCYIEFNSGNAWSGTDAVTVPTSCSVVQKAIEDARSK